MGFFGRSKKVKKSSSVPAGLRPTNLPPPLPPNKPTFPSAIPPPPASQHCHHSGLTHPEHQQPPAHFQPAGYLPAPPGWNPGIPVQGPPLPHHRPCQPIVVNQHYYISPHSLPHQKHGAGALCKWTGSMVNLAKDISPINVIPQLYDDGLSAWESYSSQLIGQTTALYSDISRRFNDVMTMIDKEAFAGYEKDLFTYQPAPPPVPTPPSEPRRKGKVEKGSQKSDKYHPKGQTSAVAATVVSGGYFAKVDLYSNSRLPSNLPPLQLYIDTWPLICLAAQYSERVYDAPRGAERDAHVGADWRTGSKSMVIKSVPMDHMNTIVFAIRGTATFMDWVVNLNMAPMSPAGFLDEPENHCHSGFLTVAKKLVKPVAARLRQLIQEVPERTSYSLLITGHSAGGAVAALLYSHMLATTKEAESELNILTGCFKRVHCVTFGAPPVSLRPLQRPDRPELRKSIFLSFVNEGDPVARADKAYVKSLLELFATPAPAVKSKDKKSSSSAASLNGKTPKKEKSKMSLASKASRTSAKSISSSSSRRSSRPEWKVPPCTLSNAGRLIIMRSGDRKAKLKDKKTVQERLNEGVVAQTAHEEQLRGIIWGDPVCHVMKLYSGRIETLAVAAVTAQRH